MGHSSVSFHFRAELLTRPLSIRTSRSVASVIF